MVETVSQLNFLLALGTLLAQVVVLILLGLFFFQKDSPVIAFLGEYGIHFIFLISLAGVVISLIYSEVFGFIPCGLCWLQRVFLYPQVILALLALLKRDRGIADYLLSLSIVGALIALYQHYLQMGGAVLINCPAVGVGADCAKRIVFEFGYITFPLMSFTIFALIIMLALIVRTQKVFHE